jgi:hypothetical protein
MGSAFVAILYSVFFTPGVDVMITNFIDFSECSAKNGVFLKIQFYYLNF